MPALFALYAARMNPEAGGVPDERQKQLKELIARRRQLVGLLVQERNRLASAYETEVKLSPAGDDHHVDQRTDAHRNAAGQGHRGQPPILPNPTAC